MRRYRIVNWLMVMAFFVFTLVLFIFSPSRIVMSFNGAGLPASWGDPGGLYLEPVMLFGLAWICERVAIHQRRRDGLMNLQMITVGEWRYLALVFLAMVCMAVMQLYQIGWLHRF